MTSDEIKQSVSHSNRYTLKLKRSQKDSALIGCTGHELRDDWSLASTHFVDSQYAFCSYGRWAFSVAGCAIRITELVTRQSERSGHQQRLIQAFTLDILIFSLIVYIAHWSFLDHALYKFAYLLTYFISCV